MNTQIKYTNTQVKGKYPVINVVMTLVMTSVKVMTWLRVKKSYDYDCLSQLKSDRLSHSQMRSQSHDFVQGPSWLRHCAVQYISYSNFLAIASATVSN